MTKKLFWNSYWGVPIKIINTFHGLACEEVFLLRKAFFPTHPPSVMALSLFSTALWVGSPTSWVLLLWGLRLRGFFKYQNQSEESFICWIKNLSSCLLCANRRGNSKANAPSRPKASKSTARWEWNIDRCTIISISYTRILLFFTFFHEFPLTVKSTSSCLSC